MRIRVILGLTISAALLVLAAWHVNPRKAVTLIKDVNLAYLGLSAALSISAVWFRAWRWRYLLPESSRVRSSNLFAATMIGYMANNLLPLRIGDIARAYVGARMEQASASAFFATLVVEHLLDIFTILLMLGVLVFLVPFPVWITKGAYLLLGVSLLALALLLLAKAKKEQVSSFIHRKFPFQGAQRIVDLTQAFFGGLKGLEAGRELIVVAFLSIPIWAAYALAIYTALIASHLDLPLVASLVVLSFLGIGVSLPSAPGFVGTFQFFTVSALTIFAVDQGEAFGFSVILHLSQFVPITLIGWLLLLREQVTLSDLSTIKRRSGQGTPL